MGAPNSLFKVVQSKLLIAITSVIFIVACLFLIGVLSYSIHGMIVGKVFEVNMDSQYIILRNKVVAHFDDIISIKLESKFDGEYYTKSLKLFCCNNRSIEVLSCSIIDQVEELAEKMSDILEKEIVVEDKV